MSWLSRIFGNPKKDLEELTVYKAEPKKKRKTRKLLSEEEMSNVVVDYSILRMKQKDIATKYNVSQSYVSKIVKESGLRG